MELISNDNNLKEIHEYNRKFANSFSKMPKSLRLNVTNITTFFIKDGPFSEALITWSQEQTRIATGGEFHSIFLINCKNMIFHGQVNLKTTYLEYLILNLKVWIHRIVVTTSRNYSL